MRGGKKIEIIGKSNNKSLISQAMGINNRNIYSHGKKEEEDLKVKNKIEDVFRTHPAYGHRRLAIELKMNKKKVRRIMKRFSLKPPRLWHQKKYITKANNQYYYGFNNLIKDINAPKVNEVWSSDLTYIKYQRRFLYLAVIQDISTKQIVALSIGDKHNRDLVLKTMKEAELKQNILPHIFHSDRGREFLNEDCLNYLKNNNVEVSMSDSGSPWQNGHIESFFSRFKAEIGDLDRFEGLGELLEYIYQYVYYYNNERIITRLKMSPIKYKQSLRMCS